MKQIKFISMLLLATLALTFNACSNDGDDDKPDLSSNYKEILERYENSTFEWTNPVNGNTSTLEIHESYYLLDSDKAIYYLRVIYPGFIASSYIGYDKKEKSFYFGGTTNSSEPTSEKYWLKFIDYNTIEILYPRVDLLHLYDNSVRTYKRVKE